MRIFDRILREETKRCLTSIDDIDYLLIRADIEQPLIDECVIEFDLDPDDIISIRDISDYMGMRIKVGETETDFEFVLK